jgi:Tfp pilus assembly protein PilX
MTNHKLQKSSEGGFALLLALVVVSVIISIGLTVLDLTMKQIRLSTNSKDSEIAFHAANAGLECARYWRIAEAADMETGATVSMACFGRPAVNVSATSPSSGAYVYEQVFEGGPTTALRCSLVKTLVIVSSAAATTTVTSMETIIPGYPYGDTKDCEPGGRCTIISVQGFSKNCSNRSVIGTVQREVLLEL